MFRPKLQGFLAGVGLLLGAGGHAVAAELEPVTLQLKWKHQFQSAGYYAAIAQGYYREAGFEVTLREPLLGEEPARVVLAGKAEFGVAGSDLVQLRAAGEPVVTLAAIMQHSPLAFVAPAAGPIKTVHDLAGKRVMLEAHAEELLAYLKVEGIAKEAVEWVPHTFDPQALIAGEVAAMSAYVTDEVFLLADAGVPYVAFSPRSGGIDFYGDVLFTTEVSVAEDPERVERFRAASLRGWTYALEHPEEMVELIYTAYSQRHSRAHLRFEARHMQQLILPDVVELGYQNPGRWRHIAEVYRELGMIGSAVDLNGMIWSEQDVTEKSVGLVIALVGAVVVILGLVGVIVRFAQLNLRVKEQAASLQEALGEIKELRGIIPICAGCKKVRDDEGYWNHVEIYVAEHTRAEFSHGFCEECMERLYPEAYRAKRLREEGEEK